MRPDSKNSICNPLGEINQNQFLNLVFGRIKTLHELLKSVFLKGSFLGFSFWYTVNLIFYSLEQIFYCSSQCEAPFFQSKNLLIKPINLSA